MCGPRQFFFQCGPEVPKCCTPLSESCPQLKPCCQTIQFLLVRPWRLSSCCPAAGAPGQWVWVSLCGPFTPGYLCVTQPQSLLLFTARSYGDFSSQHWNPGFGSLVWGCWSSGGISTAETFLCVFNWHTWMWDQPVLLLCPAPVSMWLLFISLKDFYSAICQAVLKEWKLFCGLIVILIWLWKLPSMCLPMLPIHWATPARAVLLFKGLRYSPLSLPADFFRYLSLLWSNTGWMPHIKAAPAHFTSTQFSILSFIFCYIKSSTYIIFIEFPEKGIWLAQVIFLKGLKSRYKYLQPMNSH